MTFLGHNVRSGFVALWTMPFAFAVLSHWIYVNGTTQPVRDAEPPKPMAAANVEAGREPTEKGDWREYRPYYNLAFALASNGKIKEATKLFQFCAQKAPAGSLPWVKSNLMLGVISESVGNFDKANEFYGKYASVGIPFVRDARTVVSGSWEQVRKKAVENKKSTGE